jgi:hypothetical protein
MLSFQTEEDLARHRSSEHKPGDKPGNLVETSGNVIRQQTIAKERNVEVPESPFTLGETPEGERNQEDRLTDAQRRERERETDAQRREREAREREIREREARERQGTQRR